MNKRILFSILAVAVFCSTGTVFAHVARKEVGNLFISPRIRRRIRSQSDSKKADYTGES